MSRQHHYYVYILANRPGGTIHVGVTNDLIHRISQHGEGTGSTFTRRYGVHRLVWYEPHTDILEAIRREKRLKKWKRAWKVALIEEFNPEWVDLYPAISGSLNYWVARSSRAMTIYSLQLAASPIP